MPRSGPGIVIARPLSVTSPAVAASKPATMLRKVDFPHPLGPTIAMNSLGLMVNEKSRSAVISSPRLISRNTLVTLLATIPAAASDTSITLPPLVPPKYVVCDRHHDQVRYESEQPDAQHRGNNDVHSQVVVRVPEYETKPSFDGKHFRHDYEHPGRTESNAQTCEYGRQRGREHDSGQDVQSRATKRLCRTYQCSRYALHACDRIDDDGEERTQRNEENGRAGLDAEKDDGKRQPCRYGYRTDDLD